MAIDTALLTQLIRGAEKTFSNAEALYNEACLLGAAGAFSRALFLHQISLEECAKTEVIGGNIMALLMGKAVDLERMRKAFLSHERKNRTNAYFLEPSAEELAAREQGDVKKAANAFREIQDQFHLESNSKKNASLYVDIDDGTFVAPAEVITAEMAHQARELNERYLGLTLPKLEMAQNIEKDPDEYQRSSMQFEKRMHELKSEFPNDPVKALNIVMQEMLEERMRARAARGDH